MDEWLVHIDGPPEAYDGECIAFVEFLIDKLGLFLPVLLTIVRRGELDVIRRRRPVILVDSSCIEVGDALRSSAENHSVQIGTRYLILVEQFLSDAAVDLRLVDIADVGVSVLRIDVPVLDLGWCL